MTGIKSAPKTRGEIRATKTQLQSSMARLEKQRLVVVGTVIAIGVAIGLWFNIIGIETPWDTKYLDYGLVYGAVCFCIMFGIVVCWHHGHAVAVGCTVALVATCAFEGGPIFGVGALVGNWILVGAWTGDVFGRSFEDAIGSYAQKIATL